jgi:hypothetical protein
VLDDAGGAWGRGLACIAFAGEIDCDLPSNTS